MVWSRKLLVMHHHERLISRCKVERFTILAHRNARDGPIVLSDVQHTASVARLRVEDLDFAIYFEEKKRIRSDRHINRHTD